MLFRSVPYDEITKAQRFISKTAVLGLGFGAGAKVLCKAINLGAKQYGFEVDVDEDEAKRIVGVYREKNHKVVELWGEADQMLESMMSEKIDKPLSFGLHGCVTYDSEGVILPNGLRIRYPNLRREWEDGKSRIVYDSRKGPVSIWGGSVVENVVQALARIVVGQQMLAIADNYRVVLTVHDAAVVVVPVDEIGRAHV